jgi:hypothetical protein
MGHRVSYPCYSSPLELTDNDILRSLTHDLVLPIWKSTSSISLMIDKKAKRYDLSCFTVLMKWGKILTLEC